VNFVGLENAQHGLEPVRQPPDQFEQLSLSATLTQAGNHE
jgi:hypothetical protein